MGTPDLGPVFPFPAQRVEDEDQGDAFLSKLKEFLESQTDPDEIDASGEIPDRVIDGLAKLGAFGIKIPTRYGGLGLSQTNYSRAAMVLGGHWRQPDRPALGPPVDRGSPAPAGFRDRGPEGSLPAALCGR